MYYFYCTFFLFGYLYYSPVQQVAESTHNCCKRHYTKEEEGCKSKMAASIESLFVEIASLEEPIEELQTLKTAVLSIPVSALRDTVSGLRLEVIFSLLNTNDRSVTAALLSQALLLTLASYLAQQHTQTVSQLTLAWTASL